ncbi:hypothetical protein OV203_32335 [Nannocystis sp. ILAH1]|uniref:hypothetical protein n=1 Tax=unclassified Nannocystis TaxID=2627009 RepID=UPI00226D83A2|nr:MULTISPECIES: hypothetical protein [unclassified Nannocystis]MCY0991870.1 hypothetical protein [Nannocystis sp. ILAH1]MCY1064121.1 hypothetical protein [Nannocystis sp. RBIL2]
MRSVHDILPCTIPQNPTAEPMMPAVELSAGLAADRQAGRAGWHGRGFQRFLANLA